MRVAAQLLGALLEVPEPVVVLLEEVGDLVEGAVVEAQRVFLVVVSPRARQPRQHVVELRAGVLVEVEERGDGGDHLRLRADAREVVLGEVERAHERLVQQARQAVVHARLAQRRHELLHADLEQLERLEQQGQLHGALALLDEAQVGRRDLEAPRHLTLLEAARHAQLAEPGAHGRVVGLHRHWGGFQHAERALQNTGARRACLRHLYKDRHFNPHARLDHSNAYVTHNSKVRRRVKL
jgi:hypothetical protein